MDEPINRMMPMVKSTDATVQLEGWLGYLESLI